MSVGMVKASVTQQPTKRELIQAAAQVIAEENKERNRARWTAITKARAAFHEALRKAAKRHAIASLKNASCTPVYRDSGVYKVETEILVPLDEKLTALKQVMLEAENIPSHQTDPKVIERQLNNAATRIPRTSRIAAIINTPELRNAAKQFAERLLTTPTEEDKSSTIEIGGAQ